MIISFIFVLLCANIYTHDVLDTMQWSWSMYNKNGTIQVPGKVPGGIYSDLQTAGVIEDILYRFNDVTTRWVARDTWTYEGRFNVTTNHLVYEVANLVLHGVDTIAYIELNENPIGSTKNMFVRYVFDVKPHLKVGENQLKITFESPINAANERSIHHFTAPDCVPADYNGECHANQLRKMQASFSWDWGPAFPSVGLWKPLAIEFYNRAIIRSVRTHTEKKGQHWNLKIQAHIESNTHYRTRKGYLRADLMIDGNKITVTKDLENSGSDEVEMKMIISENVVSLWWPNGYGLQQLYDLRVSIHMDVEDGTVEDHIKHLRIGFRTIEVVEQNASLIFGNETAGEGLTFYFKINGYPIFMKGSNWIPAHILPELSSDIRTVDSLLEAAKSAHMSMLRVWGGGVYESDHFYNKCDELGILIWQDFLFACSMYPADQEFLDNVRTEIVQNVIRLQHHPSIAIWAGNNENEVALRGDWYGTSSEFDRYKEEYIKLYVDTIKPIVEELDPGRRYLVSSPSNGRKSEEDGYIANNPYDPHYGDTHYYNYVGDNWDANIYPKTRFASEYGFQSLPSFATMETATREKEDFNIDSDYSKHRQHSPLGYIVIANQITSHMKLDDERYFEKFVFYSQITQAMAMKTETEYYRQSQADWYTMGALYWQLNDVWQAPSWSGIEYGGKWKMLHYFAKSFFAAVLVSPRLLSSSDVDVYLINDRFVPIIDGKIKVDIYNWTSLIPIMTHEYPANVGPLSAKKQDIKLSLWDKAKEQIFVRFSLEARGVPSSPYNYVFPKPLKSIEGLLEPNIRISVTTTPESPDMKPKDLLEYWVHIRVDAIVLFLWLDTTSIDGHFEENGLIVTQPLTKVRFFSKNTLQPVDLKNDITFQYYMN